MPIYEYECAKCGHHTEVMQKFSDPPPAKCELCHGKMKKLISQSTFHLKGTGWYVTDYASKSGAGGTQTPSPKGDKKVGKTESKVSSSSESSTKKDASTSSAKEK